MAHDDGPIAGDAEVELQYVGPLPNGQDEPGNGVLGQQAACAAVSLDFEAVRSGGHGRGGVFGGRFSFGLGVRSVGASEHQKEPHRKGQGIERSEHGWKIGRGGSRRAH